MTQTFYVVVLVVRPALGGYELLMARRSEGNDMGGTWQLISGALEPNETAWQAALRELHEETGLKPVEFYRLSTLTQFYRPDNDSLNTAPMFGAIVSEDCPVTINDEHSEFAWVNVEEARSRLMWPSDQAALEELSSVILGDGLAKNFLRMSVTA